MGVRDRAYSRNATNRQRPDEIKHLFGWHHSQAIGLLEVRRNLRYEHIRSHTRGGGKAGLLENLVLDRGGDSCRAWHAGLIDCDVQVRFIQGKRLYKVCVLAEDGADNRRVLLIFWKIRFYEHTFGTPAVCFGAGHRGVDAIFSSHIVGCCHDRAGFGGPAHHHRLVPQVRTFQQFHRCIEHIHVHMNDLSHLLGIRHTVYRYCKSCMYDYRLPS